MKLIQISDILYEKKDNFDNLIHILQAKSHFLLLVLFIINFYKTQLIILTFNLPEAFRYSFSSDGNQILIQFLIFVIDIKFYHAIIKIKFLKKKLFRLTTAGKDWG